MSPRVLSPGLSRTRARRGETTVEFAIAIVVILAFFLGIIDWGIAYHIQQRIVHQASEAARWVSVRGNSSTLIDQGRNVVMCGKPSCGGGDFIPAGLTADKITITSSVLSDTVSNFTTNPRRHIVVSIEGFEYRMFTPFAGQLLRPRRIVVSHPAECYESTCADVL